MRVTTAAGALRRRAGARGRRRPYRRHCCGRRLAPGNGASDRRLKKTDGDLDVTMVRNPDVLAALGERKGATFPRRLCRRNRRPRSATRARSSSASVSTRSPSTTCAANAGSAPARTPSRCSGAREGGANLAAQARRELAARLLDAIETLRTSRGVLLRSTSATPRRNSAASTADGRLDAQLARYDRTCARTPDEYGVFFAQLFAAGGVDPSAVDAVVIASVVPKLDPVLDAVCRLFFGVAPLFLRAHDAAAHSGPHRISGGVRRRSRRRRDRRTRALRCAADRRELRHGDACSSPSRRPASIWAWRSHRALPFRSTRSSDAPPNFRRSRSTRRNARSDARHDAALHSGIVYGFAGQTEAIVERMRARTRRAGARRRDRRPRGARSPATRRSSTRSIRISV